MAALVKQIPVFEEMRLGPDGRLQRAGLPLEMSAYCRRAVAEGVLLATQTGGTCTVFTLGPPSAEDCLREAVAFGADAGVLVTDPAFAGSDTLATAQALTAALAASEARLGPFDLILVGRNSVDADTRQVGPEIAQLLDRAFVTGVKRLTVRPESDCEGTDGSGVVADVGLEHDDGWVEASVVLPAVMSTAERLIDPCKIKDPAVWATVDPERIVRVSASDLGPGPWGQEGSPTWVGEVRAETVDRDGVRLTGPLAAQVDQAVRFLADRGALHTESTRREVAATAAAPVPVGAPGPTVAVVVEPGRERLTRELLSGAARLAGEIAGQVAVFGDGAALVDLEQLAAWGADQAVVVEGDDLVEEDIAAALSTWAAGAAPWAVLVGGTAWGREVAARAAAALGAGLTGDAVGLAVEAGRLVSWKPAFGGTLVAAIHSTSPVQMATVRAGVLGTSQPRTVPRAIPVAILDARARGRVTVRSQTRDDNFDDLLNAEMVVGVGQGVDPDEYGALDGLLDVLEAELAATRKVTDQDWMPHARQIGITGHSISPRLYVAIGTSGKYNHMVGVRSAGTILAINPDPDALVFAVSDIGIVADWHQAVPLLAAALAAAKTTD